MQGGAGLLPLWGRCEQRRVTDQNNVRRLTVADATEMKPWIFLTLGLKKWV